jgi:hypothetical protein
VLVVAGELLNAIQNIPWCPVVVQNKSIVRRRTNSDLVPSRPTTLKPEYIFLQWGGKVRRKSQKNKLLHKQIEQDFLACLFHFYMFYPRFLAREIRLDANDAKK